MTEAIAMTERFQQVGDLEITKMPDGYVVYRPESDRVLFLNMTAAVIFELCDGRQSLGEIMEILVSGYELDEFPAAEFETCVTNLLDEGLILPCPR